MDEELDLLPDYNNTGVDNSDNVDNVDLLDDSEVEDPVAIATGPYDVNVLNDTFSVIVDNPVEYDYSYLQTTNQYLFCIIVLLVTYITLYIFNSLRAFFQRIGG